MIISVISKLNDYISYIEDKYFEASDINIGKLVVSSDIVKERYRAYCGFPVKVRLTKAAKDIVRRIKMSPRYERHQSVAGIQSAVKKMFRTLSIKKLYREFYDWCDAPSMLKSARGGILEFSDVFPLVYLKMKIEGVQACGYEKVKHLVVDEMQDYTPVQYAVLSELFRCKMTILGDANQSVNPYSSTSYMEIERLFGGAQCFKLNKSYRSNYEITTFAQDIRKNEELVPVERHGEKPVVKIVESEQEQIRAIQEISTGEAVEKYPSIGIICKTYGEAETLFSSLEDLVSSVVLLSPESKNFKKGVVITTAHMAKGLEFDRVIIPFACPQTYKTETDRCMLYIACTRALHSLWIFSIKELTTFIKM